jgi:hypothetical protein
VLALLFKDEPHARVGFGLEASALADGASVGLDGRVGVAQTFKDTPLDRGGFGVRGADAARGGYLFERAVVVVGRHQRARESDARGGEARTQGECAAVKLGGLLRAPGLLARLFGLLEE